MQPNTGDPDNAVSSWRPAQAYTLAIICLLIGLPIGYLLRGSAVPATTAAAASAATPNAAIAAPAKAAAAAPAAMPSMDDMKRMANKQVSPLLAELEKKPNDAALLNKVALMYKAAHQFDEAATYFKKSLDNDPKNIAVRDDYASCLYYLGEADAALAQLQRSLTYDPKHAGTLYNIGIIRWKAKGDVDGAVDAWKKLLELNPTFARKDMIEQLIQAATASKSQVASAKKG
jgi:tetratricopeptide (TPR) repeat protein